MTGTIIGKSILIEGDIDGTEDITVQGTIKGKIVLDQTVLIENTAIVQADIQSASIVISGQVNGNLLANEKVELRSEGRMTGDIKAPRILIAEGATFRGTVNMER